MYLDVLVSGYLAERSVSVGYADSLLVLVRQFSEHLDRAASTDDLATAVVNAWLESLESGELSRHTVRNKRRMLLTLWRAAFDDGLVKDLPRKIRRIRVDRKVPRAPNHAKLAALLAVIDRLEGTFRKLPAPRRLYMRSLVNGQYDSGLRIGDVQSLERDWITPSGRLTLIQSKTGRQHTICFREETMRDIQELIDCLPGRRLIWPPFGSRHRFFRFFRRLRLAAGLNCSTKGIRRASASYVERDRPGTAWRHLGHSRPGLDTESYIDPDIAYPDPTLPPPIGG